LFLGETQFSFNLFLDLLNVLADSFLSFEVIFNLKEKYLVDIDMLESVCTNLVQLLLKFALQLIQVVQLVLFGLEIIPDFPVDLLLVFLLFVQLGDQLVLLSHLILKAFQREVTPLQLSINYVTN